MVVLLGPGSMAMHATQTTLGGHLDMTSMFLVASFAVGVRTDACGRSGHCVLRRRLRVALLACELVERIPGELPVVMHAGNLVFGALLVLAVVIEVRLRRASGPAGDVRWILGAVGAIAVAFVVWNLSKNGAPWCDPHSYLQGHGVWHLLCALSAYCLYRYWCSAATADGAQTVERSRPSQ